MLFNGALNSAWATKMLSPNGGVNIPMARFTVIITPKWTKSTPIAHAIGVDLVHFGVIMTVNLAIGMFTPPFGLNIFVAQALFRAPLSSIYPGLVPFIIINLIALALVTYIPELSLFLLQYMG